MNKTRSFRKDLRSKLILFGLVPLFLFGVVSLWPIYQNEWIRLENEHRQLLNAVKRIVTIFYEQSRQDFKNLDTDIQEEKITDLDHLLHRYGEIDSLQVLDSNGTLLKSVSRLQSSKQPHQIDQKILQLLHSMKEHNQTNAYIFYYSPYFKKVLATHLLRYEGKTYIANINAQHYFQGIKDLIQRSEIRSVYIYTPDGRYIYHSGESDPVIHGKSVFETSDYLAAIRGKKPYRVTEYPSHYKEGDSFWRGLFDLDAFLSYLPLKDPPLTIVVKDSEDTIDYYLGGLLFIWITLMLFTVLLVLGVSKVMLNYILNPVEKTITNINNLSAGRPPVPQEPSDRTYSIFSELVRSFEKMRRTIKDREEKLNEQLIINTEIQKKLAENEKKAALGDITSNIAHQWRQPLSTISTLATGMLMEKEMGTLDESSFKEYCKQINDNAQFLSNTIEDFRRFSPSDKEEEYFEIQNSLNNLLKILGKRLEEQKIHTEIHVPVGVKIYGYGNHFLQMMINLVNNSIDALESHQEQERYLEISVSEAEENLVIRVRDNGGGIDPKIINRIFEPYFTTKHKSQGTGLGLHMAQRLAEESLRGSIRVENITFTYRGREYKGTEFVITLPKNRKEPQSKDRS